MKYDLDEDLIRGTRVDIGTAIAVIIGIVGIVCLLIWA